PAGPQQSGAVGGSFALAALPIELPISTVIMLRSIGDIARAEGEDLSDPETTLSCLQVFALGGLEGKADAANSGYFAARGLLAVTRKWPCSCGAGSERATVMANSC